MARLYDYKGTDAYDDGVDKTYTFIVTEEAQDGTLLGVYYDNSNVMRTGRISPEDRQAQEADAAPAQHSADDRNDKSSENLLDLNKTGFTGSNDLSGGNQ